MQLRAIIEILSLFMKVYRTLVFCYIKNSFIVNKYAGYSYFADHKRNFKIN